jgi:hypothetical protein
MHALCAGCQPVSHQAGYKRSLVGCCFTLKAVCTVQAVEGGNRAVDSGLGVGICLLDWSPGPCVEGGPSLAAPAGPPPCACCHVSPCPHGSVFFLPLCLLLIYLRKAATINPLSSSNSSRSSKSSHSSSGSCSSSHSAPTAAAAAAGCNDLP